VCNQERGKANVTITFLTHIFTTYFNGRGTIRKRTRATRANPWTNLENLIRPYVEYITFGIDVSAGIIIGISAIMALVAFLKILLKPG
jgi:hypothetical protein